MTAFLENIRLEISKISPRPGDVLLIKILPFDGAEPPTLSGSNRRHIFETVHRELRKALPDIGDSGGGGIGAGSGIGVLVSDGTAEITHHPAGSPFVVTVKSPLSDGEKLALREAIERSYRGPAEVGEMRVQPVKVEFVPDVVGEPTKATKSFDWQCGHCRAAGSVRLPLFSSQASIIGHVVNAHFGGECKRTDQLSIYGLSMVAGKVGFRSGSTSAVPPDLAAKIQEDIAELRANGVEFGVACEAGEARPLNVEGAPQPLGVLLVDGKPFAAAIKPADSPIHHYTDDFPRYETFAALLATLPPDTTDRLRGRLIFWQPEPGQFILIDGLRRHMASRSADDGAEVRDEGGRLVPRRWRQLDGMSGVPLFFGLSLSQVWTAADAESRKHLAAGGGAFILDVNGTDGIACMVACEWEVQSAIQEAVDRKWDEAQRTVANARATRAELPPVESWRDRPPLL